MYEKSLLSYCHGDAYGGLLAGAEEMADWSVAMLRGYMTPQAKRGACDRRICQ